MVHLKFVKRVDIMTSNLITENNKEGGEKLLEDDWQVYRIDCGDCFMDV